MLRSTRSLAILSSVFVLAILSAAMARPADQGSTQFNVVAVAPPPVAATLLDAPSVPVLTMRFQPSADAVDHEARWSPRTQKAIQKAAFRHAVGQTFASRDFSPGTFAGSMLDSLVDFAGPDNVIEYAKSFRPKPDQYRALLRAIRDRTPTVDPGDRNRSS